MYWRAACQGKGLRQGHVIGVECLKSAFSGEEYKKISVEELPVEVEDNQSTWKMRFWKCLRHFWMTEVLESSGLVSSSPKPCCLLQAPPVYSILKDDWKTEILFRSWCSARLLCLLSSTKTPLWNVVNATTSCSAGVWLQVFTFFVSGCCNYWVIAFKLKACASALVK